MVIRIEGVSGINKGAELMLVAIINEITKRYNNPIIMLGNFNQKSLLRRVVSFIVSKYIFMKKSRAPFDDVFSTKRLLSTLPLIPYNENIKVDIILDAGGFQFSDQFGDLSKKIVAQVSRLKTAKEMGAKVVFLPQAFGPFEKETSLKSINRISRYTDLFIAREKVSADYLKNAIGDKKKVKIYSDFTNLQKGEIDERLSKEIENKICLIPNTKMITHTDEYYSKKYMSFFLELMNHLKKTNQSFFLLNHEGKDDLALCKLLRSQSAVLNVSIYSGFNAVQVKGIIGASKLVVSSRYHGVASALSQSVPVYATSWSHKYKLLFQDYDIDYGIIDYTNETESLRIIDNRLTRESLNSYKNKLDICVIHLRKQTQKMWDEVFDDSNISSTVLR